jgi:ABC-type multidrug transport system fused ATPase/permease subunit
MPKAFVSTVINAPRRVRRANFMCGRVPQDLWYNDVLACQAQVRCAADVRTIRGPAGLRRIDVLELRYTKLTGRCALAWPKKQSKNRPGRERLRKVALLLWPWSAHADIKIGAVLSITGPASFLGELRRIEMLHGVSFDVEEGEIDTLVGSNGAGKTTLLRALSGAQPTTAGTISFAGELIQTLKPHCRVALGLSQVLGGC